MDILFPLHTIARVTTAYQAPYADPIQFRAGQWIEIDDQKKTDYSGWLWGTNQTGKSGWIPESYLSREGKKARTLYDYNAIELNVQVGDLLILHKSQSGFAWVTDSTGQHGWVPEDILEIQNPETT